MLRSRWYMTALSTVRKVASPKASIAFPVSAPGPHIVLEVASVPSEQRWCPTRMNTDQDHIGADQGRATFWHPYRTPGIMCSSPR
jgi:hypothetical protein